MKRNARGFSSSGGIMALYCVPPYRSIVLTEPYFFRSGTTPELEEPLRKSAGREN
jgi:hypothetical protein